MLLLGYGATLSPALVILDWMVTTAAIAGIRFGFRGMRQYLAAQRSNGTRVLIYGSDSASVLALRHLREDDTLRRTAVGFVDADDKRVGMHVQGLSVLGTPNELASISRTHEADELIVPTFSTDRDTQRELLRICVEAGIACRLFALDLHPAAPVQLQAPTGDGMTGKETHSTTTHNPSTTDEIDEAASSSQSSS
jgi:UDP-GlcNAc:undecaprenyl-phosphate GlcNAc-1-phosphate transferase